MRSFSHHLLAVVAVSALLETCAWDAAAQVKTAPLHLPAATPTPTPTPRPLPPFQSIIASRARMAATAPMALNFGEMYSGDSRSLAVKIVPGDGAPEGDATVSLSAISPAITAYAKPVFKITEVQTWGMAAVAKSTARSTIAMAPALSGDQPHMLLRVTQPPFKLHVKPGDYLIVKMDAAPVLDIVSGPSAGNYSAAIQAYGPDWIAVVPVAEAFQGLRLGVIANLETYEETVYMPEAYTPSQAYPAPLRLTLINTEKTQQHIRINVMQLPTGMSLPAQDVVIPAGQTTVVSLPFTVQWGQGAANPGPWQKAKLEVAYDSGKRVLPFSFDLLPSLKTFSFSGNDGPTWSAQYTIHNDGRFEFSYSVTNDNLAVNRDFQFRGSWNGVDVINIAGRADRNSGKNDHYGGKSGYVQANFDLMLKSAPAVKFTYSNTM